MYNKLKKISKIISLPIQENRRALNVIETMIHEVKEIQDIRS